MNTTVAAVRTEVQAQHRALRASLERVRQHAEGLLDDVTTLEELRHELTELLQSLVEHVTFEDQHLLPLLRGRNPFGYRYARLLAEEHTRQRAQLATLARDAADPDDALALGLAIRAFAADTLQDMEDEELQFLTPHLLAG
jgi:hypothetical protein